MTAAPRPLGVNWLWAERAGSPSAPRWSSCCSRAGASRAGAPQTGEEGCVSSVRRQALPWGGGPAEATSLGFWRLEEGFEPTEYFISFCGSGLEVAWGCLCDFLDEDGFLNSHRDCINILCYTKWNNYLSSWGDEVQKWMGHGPCLLRICSVVGMADTYALIINYSCLHSFNNYLRTCSVSGTVLSCVCTYPLTCKHAG